MEGSKGGRGGQVKEGMGACLFYLPTDLHLATEEKRGKEPMPEVCFTLRLCNKQEIAV